MTVEGQTEAGSLPPQEYVEADNPSELKTGDLGEVFRMDVVPDTEAFPIVPDEDGYGGAEVDASNLSPEEIAEYLMRYSGGIDMPDPSPPAEEPVPDATEGYLSELWFAYRTLQDLRSPTAVFAAPADVQVFVAAAHLLLRQAIKEFQAHVDTTNA